MYIECHVVDSMFQYFLVGSLPASSRADQHQPMAHVHGVTQLLNFFKETVGGVLVESFDWTVDAFQEDAQIRFRHVRAREEVFQDVFEQGDVNF